MKTNKQAKQVLSVLTYSDKQLPESKRLGNGVVITVYASGYSEVKNKRYTYVDFFEEYCAEMDQVRKQIYQSALEKITGGFRRSCFNIILAENKLF